MNLAIQDPRKWTNKVNIFNENAFRLPKAQIERFLPHSIFIKKFKVQTSDGSEVIERHGLNTDVVIMNPPFTRGSRLTEGERKILLKISNLYELKHGWRDWNLYASFILLAPKFLKVGEKGKISFVLPHSVISTKYMEKVWKSIFDHTNLGVKYIINASFIEISFSDSSEQEILMLLEVGYNKPCKMIQLTKKLKDYDIEELMEVIKNIEKDGKFPTDSKYFEGHQIEQEKLQAMKSRKWSFTPPGILELLQRDFIPIDELDFVTAGGGNSSKPVDYFWLPNKYWELNGETDTEIRLNQTFELRRLLRDINKLNEIFPEQNIEEFFDNIPEEISDDIKKEIERIPKNIWMLFGKKSRMEIMILVNNIPETLTVPKKFLVKSLVRKLKSMDDQPPLFNDNYPYIFFLNYSEISEDPTEDYFIWGELLKETLASWVCAPPRSATIFFPVKIRLNTMKTIAIRSPELLDSARVAGIIFVPKNSNPKTKEDMDILFAYLTSSIFLFDYIQKGRVVSGALRQLFSTDLHALMKFPNISQLSNDEKEPILEASRFHNSRISLFDRPVFAKMISDALKKKEDSTIRKLDEAIFTAFNIPIIVLDTLYKEILKELSSKRIK